MCLILSRAWFRPACAAIAPGMVVYSQHVSPAADVNLWCCVFAIGATIELPCLVFSSCRMFEGRHLHLLSLLSRGDTCVPTSSCAAGLHRQVVYGGLRIGLYEPVSMTALRVQPLYLSAVVRGQLQTAEMVYGPVVGQYCQHKQCRSAAATVLHMTAYKKMS